MIKLTKLQNSNREKCISFAKEYVNPAIKSRDKNCVFDKELWQQCSDLNLHGIFISSDKGGLDYSMVDGMSMYESIGYAFRDNGLSFGLAAQHLSCAFTISKYASNEMHLNLTHEIIEGKSIVAHAITEKSSGSNVFAMKTEYEQTNDQGLYLIKGEKTYSSNLPVADYILCYAIKKTTSENDNIYSAFLIPKNLLSKIENIEKMGLNTCIMGQSNLDVELDKSFLLNKEGQGSAMFQEAITYERIGMSALHLGTVERLLEEIISWVKTRISGDSILSQYQSISHSLVDIHNEWQVLRSYLYSLASQDLKFSKLYFHASILKDKVSELYVNACQRILQIYGGLGYTKQIEIERMMRDALASKIYSGTTEIQKEIVWKYIS